jgi:hypothetical protein
MQKQIGRREKNLDRGRTRRCVGGGRQLDDYDNDSLTELFDSFPSQPLPGLYIASLQLAHLLTQSAGPCTLGLGFFCRRLARQPMISCSPFSLRMSLPA